MRPTDPLYSSQWHLARMGGLETVWNTYTGAGVSVIIYDDGIESTHEDLDNNYDPTGAFTYGGTTYGSTPLSSSDAHGTAVAGLIAAEANNGRGGVGVAWGADVAGLNFLEGVQFEPDAVVLAALVHASNFDVMNNSWGYTPLYGDWQSLAITGSWAQDLLAAMDTVTSTGRGGLGTVVVQASGNDHINANGDGLSASRFVVSVAAADQFGRAANFSNWGANILLTALSAAVTTDRSGNAGFNASGTLDGDPLTSTNYTSVFGGTSAAAPLVSGVIALMLDADPGLGWRDVQNILAASSHHTGSALTGGPTGSEVDSWRIANSGTWNGGGTGFHVNYGFGMVNALAAVGMAEVWRAMHGAAQTALNEVTATGGYTGTRALVDNTTTVVQAAVAANILVETVMVTVDITHSYAADLVLTLIAPDGSRFLLMQNEGQSTLMDTGFDWTFGVQGARGLSSAGTWALEVRDTSSGDTGVLSKFHLSITGATNSAADVHTFTDDFLAYKALDSSRGTLSAASGSDWLNFAAVSGNLVINFGASNQVRVDGALWASVASGSVFRKIAAGSGNDDIRPVAGNAHVSLGFGDDYLLVGGGADTLLGGAGIDYISYTNSTSGVNIDLQTNAVSGGWAADDAISGFERLAGSSTGDDTLAGTSGNNTLRGYGGNDSVYDRAGNDLVELGNGDDYVQVGGGADSLHGGSGNDYISYSRSTSGVNVDLLSNAVSGGSAAGDVISGFERIAGSSTGNDTLSGTNGGNTLRGYGGNDSIYDRDGNDTVDLGDGDDYASVGDGANTLLGGNGNDYVSYTKSTSGVNVDLLSNVVSGGWAADDVISGFERLAGSSSFNDTLSGTNSDNTLRGYGGSDSIYDRDGNDTVDLGDGNDYVQVGGGIDVLFGGNGTDYVSYANSTSGVNVDLQSNALAGGWAADDTISGFERISGSLTGADTLAGSTAANTLRGYGGADRLDGRSGNDILEGGTGNDSLTGGLGADSFVFADACQADRITDFSLAQTDRLSLDDALWVGALSAAEVVSNFASLGAAGVTFDFGGGDAILLSGLTTLAGLDTALDIV